MLITLPVYEQLYGYVYLIYLIMLINLTTESITLFLCRSFNIFERACSYTVCLLVFLIESTLPGQKKTLNVNTKMKTQLLGSVKK